MLHGSRLSFVFIVIIVVFTGSVFAQTSTKADTLVLVLVEPRSGDAYKEMRARAEQSFARAVTSFNGGEVLLGDNISGNPLAAASLPVRIEFPLSPSPKRNQVTAMRVERLRQEAKDQFKSLLEKPSTERQKDVIGSLQFAAKVFNNEENRKYSRTALLLFSDMVQETPKLNFIMENLTSATIEKIILSQKEAGALPKLDNVEVWVAGATAAEQGGLDSDRILGIENFWLRYLRECGARIVPERYSSTLIDFHLK